MLISCHNQDSVNQYLIQLLRDSLLRDGSELPHGFEEIFGRRNLTMMHFEDKGENADEQFRLVDGRLKQLQQDVEKERHFVERQNQQRFL